MAQSKAIGRLAVKAKHVLFIHQALGLLATFGSELSFRTERSRWL